MLPNCYRNDFQGFKAQKNLENTIKTKQEIPGRS